MKQKTLLFFLFISIGKIVCSQSCYVAVDSAKGSYVGKCKKGKANGQGKYEWLNNSYEGDWKNGLFDGYGILTLNKSTDSNTVLAGYWQKGEYIGKHEKNYSVDILTNSISSLSVKKQNNFTTEVYINVKNSTGGASNIENPVLPKSILSNILLTGGQYQELRTDTLSRITSRYTLHEVIFPLAATLTFVTPGNIRPPQQAKIEIYEQGTWIINVFIEN